MSVDGLVITSVQCHGTIGSLTFRVLGDKLWSDNSFFPMWQGGGEVMKLLHVCYAALGFAVARWFFRREAAAMADPVARLRVSGLL